MKQKDYDAINYGVTTETLIGKYGQPFQTTRYPDGLVEYHYIQRIPVRPDLVDEVHYYFTVRDDTIISKRCSSGGSSVDLNFSN